MELFCDFLKFQRAVETPVYRRKFRVLTTIEVRYKEHKVLTTNRDEIRIHGNSESHTSVVNVCVGKGSVFNLWGAGIDPERSQRNESASNMFWKLPQTPLSHHKRINGQFHPFSSFTNDGAMLYRCNNGWPVRKLPMFSSQRWRLPEAGIRNDTVEASAELNSRRTKEFELDEITRLD